MAPSPIYAPGALDSSAATHRLYRRSGGSTGGLAAGIAIVAVIALTVIGYYVLRHLRKRHSNPAYVPSKWLKDKWRRWDVSQSSSITYSSAADNEADPPPAQGRTASPANNMAMTRSSQNFEVGLNRQSRTVEDDVNRRISVRSIMTLPTYSADVRPSEQVIGREGERSGIDTVVEFPETGDEEHSRYEEEQLSLYAIRTARRRERAEREDRRRRRQEAEARGDRRALREIRQEEIRANSRNRPQEPNADELLRQHNLKDRGRKISEVSYSDLGLARHDGSRVRLEESRARANSSDSNRPLLDSAASIGASNRRGSNADSTRGHQHNPSVSSSLAYEHGDVSDAERASDEFDVVPVDSNDTGTSRPSTNHTRRERPSISTTNLNGADLGEVRVADPEQTPLPPRYSTHSDFRPRSEAPPYSAIRTSVPPLPTGSHLPDIHVTPQTPASDPREEDEEQAH